MDVSAPLTRTHHGMTFNAQSGRSGSCRMTQTWPAHGLVAGHCEIDSCQMITALNKVMLADRLLATEQTVAMAQVLYSMRVCS